MVLLIFNILRNLKIHLSFMITNISIIFVYLMIQGIQLRFKVIFNVKLVARYVTQLVFLFPNTFFSANHITNFIFQCT